MIFEELADEYFNWLVGLVYTETLPDVYQHRIYSYMNSRVFDWSIPGDENRALAGRNLRNMFIYEYGINVDEEEFNYIIDELWQTDGTCTVFECLVGVAKEWEDELAFDSRFGDRTTHWFWNHMMYNLGIRGNHLSNIILESIIDKWLYREYDDDGNGNIFTIPGFQFGSMLDMEIWYQVCAYMNYLESEDFEHVGTNRDIR